MLCFLGIEFSVSPSNALLPIDFGATVSTRSDSLALGIAWSVLNLRATRHSLPSIEFIWFKDLGEDVSGDSSFSQGTRYVGQPVVPWEAPHRLLTIEQRFATLLLYLNEEGLEGGETTFPKYVNAESFDQLRVNPEEGKVRFTFPFLYTLFFSIRYNLTTTVRLLDGKLGCLVLLSASR